MPAWAWSKRSRHGSTTVSYSTMCTLAWDQSRGSVGTGGIVHLLGESRWPPKCDTSTEPRLLKLVCDIHVVWLVRQPYLDITLCCKFELPPFLKRLARFPYLWQLWKIASPSHELTPLPPIQRRFNSTVLLWQWWVRDTNKGEEKHRLQPIRLHDSTEVEWNEYE